MYSIAWISVKFRKYRYWWCESLGYTIYRKYHNAWISVKFCEYRYWWYASLSLSLPNWALWRRRFS